MTRGEDPNHPRPPYADSISDEEFSGPGGGVSPGGPLIREATPRPSGIDARSPRAYTFDDFHAPVLFSGSDRGPVSPPHHHGHPHGTPPQFRAPPWHHGDHDPGHFHQAPHMAHPAHFGGHPYHHGPSAAVYGNHDPRFGPTYGRGRGVPGMPRGPYKSFAHREQIAIQLTNEEAQVVRQMEAAGYPRAVIDKQVQAMQRRPDIYPGGGWFGMRR